MGFFARLFGLEASGPQPVHITDANFEDEVFRSELPVLLDVWGPNCAPCHQLEPIIMRLAKTYAGRVKVAELNAAASPRAAERLRVRGTPTVVYLVGRVEVTRVVGFRGDLYHQQVIDEELLPRAAEEKAKAEKAAAKATKGAERKRAAR